MKNVDDLFNTERTKEDPLTLQETAGGDPSESNRSVLGQGVSVFTSKATSSVALLANSTKAVANTATGLVSKNPDGDFQSAAFVSFRTLAHKNAALQMVHHDKPFSIEVAEAPGPEDSEYEPGLLFAAVISRLVSYSSFLE